jgi:hypothetical protein
MRKLSLLLAILVTVSTAAGFTATLTPEKRSSSPENPAKFSITVENNATEPTRFLLDYDFTRSGWIYASTSKTIDPGDTGTFDITITPDDRAIEQSYSVNFYVTNFKTGRMKTLTDYFNVNRDYRLNVVDFSVERTDYMPGDTVRSSITVENLAPRIVSDYSFRSSIGDEVEEGEGEPLAPRASKTYSFSRQIPENAGPGERNVSIKLFFDGETRTFHDQIEVAEIREVDREVEESDRVVQRSAEITWSNSGNSRVNLSENVTFSDYLSPVLSFEPEPDTVKDSGERNTYIWNFRLKPGETATFSYSVDYWMPLTIAAVILAGIIILRRLSGNMKIRKKVEEEGGKLKVSLEVVNKTERTKDEIEIEDFVPNVAELDEDFEMAQPEMKKTVDGVQMKWTLDDFRPDEKRVLQYRVTPKVEIEGGIDLPEAEIQEDDSTVAKSDRKE